MTARDEKIAELARLLAVFPIQGASRETTRLRMEGYLDAIDPFPAWVVQVACLKVRRGLFPELSRAFAPTPAELAEIIRGLLVKEHQTNNVTGEISFDGEVPMTWIPEGDPRWAELCAIAKRADPRNKHYPMMSKYAPGLGSFFRTEFVKAVG